jgi:RNA recognition motif-containing protein
MNIYVDNLSHDVTGDDLRELFESFGKVETANVAEHHRNGQSRGFGFVRMPSRNDGARAIAGLAGASLKGQTIAPDEVRAPEPVSGVCRPHCSCFNRT